MQDPPTLDHRVRAEISKIPSEIFDLETLKDVKSKQSAYDLANRVEYALQVTSDYNSRLMQEVEHRKKLNLQLNDFTNAQKEIIDQGKERLKVKFMFLTGYYQYSVCVCAFRTKLSHRVELKNFLSLEDISLCEGEVC